MTKEKGLSIEVADRIGEYVKLYSGKELVDSLEGDSLRLVSLATPFPSLQSLGWTA